MNVLLSEWAGTITMYSHSCITLCLFWLLLILYLLQGLPGERGLPGSEGKAVSEKFSIGRANPMVQGKRETGEEQKKHSKRKGVSLEF